jgi:hypothetical protein
MLNRGGGPRHLLGNIRGLTSIRVDASFAALQSGTVVSPATAGVAPFRRVGAALGLKWAPAWMGSAGAASETEQSSAAFVKPSQELSQAE